MDFKKLLLSALSFKSFFSVLRSYSYVSLVLVPSLV